MNIKTDDFKQKVLKAFLWLGTGTFIGQLIAWCSTIIVIRLLEPADYGLMAMAGTIIALLTILSELGVGAAVIQAKTLSNIQIKQLFGLIIVLCVIGLLSTILLAPYIALFFNEPKLTLLIKVLSVNFLMIALFTIPMSLLVRNMNFKSKAKVDISAQVGGSVVTLIMAFNGMGVWSLIGGLISIHVVKVVGYNIAVKEFTLPSFRLNESIKLAKYGFVMAGNRILFYVFTQADKIIGGKILGDVFLGFYTVALTLASIPAEKILPIVTQITFASYSRIQDEQHRINRNILKTIRVMALFGFPLFFGMTAVAPEAIPILLGDKWFPAIIPFQLLCLIMPLKSLSFIFPPAVFAIDKAKVILVNMVIASVVMVIAFSVGAQWGLIGLSLAWAIVYPIVFTITTLRSLNALQLPFRKVLNEISFPVISSIVMLVCLYTIRYYYSEIGKIELLILSIIAGVVIYSALIYFFRKEMYIQLFLEIFKKNPNNKNTETND